ncbi:MAG: TIGR01777 family oxidoreductase [Bacteroidota bacterium]
MSSQSKNISKRTVLITGGSGLVGTELSKILEIEGHTVLHLSRSVAGTEAYKTYQWDIDQRFIEEEAITRADSIIHLAGASVAGAKWTEAYKNAIYDSRINSTRLLREKVEALNPDLSYFLCASAIGIYGLDSGDQWMTEQSERGEGFLADVVEDWEKEADKFSSLDIATGKLRIGVVLSNKGGALEKIVQPIKLYAGAALGSGNQYLSWIHIHDLCYILAFMLNANSVGVFNGVAPDPKTNSDFTKTAAKVLNKPLWLPNVPKFALNLLVGEMAELVLGGNRVSATKIRDSGFQFKYPELELALQELLK